MGYIVKALALVFVICFQVFSDVIVPLEMMGLLTLVVIFIFREKYLNQPIILVIESVLILSLAFSNPIYLVLYSATSYDLAVLGLYPWLPYFLPIGIVFLSGDRMAGFFLIISLSSLCGYLSRLLRQKESSFQRTYDREREIRYELEDAKGKLLNAAREAAHLAEIRERNRIAREIHDSIGHNLAGILLQLQVAKKTLARDEARAQELLDNSIIALASSVELMRDTVHNIKPRVQLGLDYIKKVVENFHFCAVNFTHSGDFASIKAAHIEIITSILKVALTNTARHSRADEVDIQLDIYEQIVRLYIKDNGIGCTQVREGLGLSGMRERVDHVGGNITINTNDGFMIVCVLPRYEKSGGGVFESVDSR